MPCLLTVCLLSGAMPSWGMEIVGHRGASHDAPENTLSSFKLGYKQNADADELDIHLSRDGKVVVMHDYDTWRTAGVSNKIAQTELSALRQLDIGQWGKWHGSTFHEKIPLLSEVLPLIPENRRLFIEIKTGPEILPGLKRVLEQAHKRPEQTAIIGFGYETVREAKRMFPNLQVYWLGTSEKKTHRYPPVEELIQKARAAGLDGLDLHSGFPIDEAFVQKVHAAGLKLYTWTVDDPELARKEKEAGVDGITTNRAGWLREQLGL